MSSTLLGLVVLAGIAAVAVAPALVVDDVVSDADDGCKDDSLEFRVEYLLSRGGGGKYGGREAEAAEREVEEEEGRGGAVVEFEFEDDASADDLTPSFRQIGQLLAYRNNHSSTHCE